MKMVTSELGCLIINFSVLPDNQCLMCQLTFCLQFLFSCKSSHIEVLLVVAGHVTKREDGEEERC